MSLVPLKTSKGAFYTSLVIRARAGTHLNTIPKETKHVRSRGMSYPHSNSWLQMVAINSGYRQVHALLRRKHRYWTNVGSILGRRRRRRANIEPALVQCLVSLYSVSLSQRWLNGYKRWPVIDPTLGHHFELAGITSATVSSPFIL